MKKKRYTAVILAVAIMILLAGCSSGEQGLLDREDGGGQDGQKEAAKGRYVERLLESPQGFEGEGAMNVLEDGSLLLVDSKTGAVSRSRDEGKSWSTKENKALHKIANQDQVEISSVAVASDGGIFFSYIPWNESTEEKRFPEKYVYFDKNGKKDEFELGLEDYCVNAVQAAFVGNDTVFFTGNDNVTVFEIDLKKHRGKKKMTAEASMNFGVYPVGDSAAVTVRDKVYLYDAEKDKLEASDEVLNDYMQGEKSEKVIVGGGRENKILTASAQGIFSHVKGGNVMEKLAEGDLTSLGSPTQEPNGLFVLKSGAILILYDSGEMDSYTYDAEASAVPDKQLNLYSLRDNITVRQAIHIFRKEHPDVYVKVTNGMSGEDGVTEDDAIKNLNTEILAGKGPDVIIMDGMPLDSYAEKGLLLDLGDLVKELESQNSYYNKILESCRRDGKIAAIPVRYKIPIMMGKREMVSAITDLKTLADAAEKEAASVREGKTVFGTYDERELLERLWPMCAGAWNGADQEADREKISDFLTQARRIYEAEQKNLTDSAKQSHKENLASLKKLDMEHNPLDGARQLMNMCLGGQRVTAGTYSSMKDVRELFSVLNQEKEDAWQIWEGQNRRVFVPEGLAAVSADTADSGLAKAFVKTLLSEEVQKKDLGDGFPVNKAAFAGFSENPNSDSYMIVSGSGGDADPDYELDLVWPSEKQLGELEEAIETLETAAVMTDRIKEEVFRIAAGALTGEKEIEDCAEEIAQKIKLLREE